MSSKHDLVFHLLDIQSRDIRIESETEEVREIAYESASEDEADAGEDDFQTRRRRRGKAASAAANGIRRELMIHLFGATETGRTVRCDISGFRPTFYIRLPEQQTTQQSNVSKNT